MDSPDVVTCIIEHLDLAGHLRFMSLCRTWRDMLRHTWGRAEHLSVTDLRLGASIAEQYRQDVVQEGRGRLPPPHPAEPPLGFFQRPNDVKTLPHGRGLCVVDCSRHEKLRRVQIFSPALEPLHALVCPAPLGYPEERGCYAEGAFRAAAASEDMLFVAYYFPGCPGDCGRIYKYSLPDLQLVGTLSSNYEVTDADDENIDDDDREWDLHFCNAEDMVVLDQRLYVCDRGGECGYPSVVAFDLDLAHLFTFGTDELAIPMGIAVHAGHIYVVDEGTCCVAVFDPNGAFQHYVRCNGDRFDDPVCIAFAHGRILVGEYTQPWFGRTSRVKVLTPDGVLLHTVDVDYNPISLCVDEAKDRVYVAAINDPRLHVLSMRG